MDNTNTNLAVLVVAVDDYEGWADLIDLVPIKTEDDYVKLVNSELQKIKDACAQNRDKYINKNTPVAQSIARDYELLAARAEIKEFNPHLKNHNIGNNIRLNRLFYDQKVLNHVYIIYRGSDIHYICIELSGNIQPFVKA